MANEEYARNAVDEFVLPDIPEQWRFFVDTDAIREQIEDDGYETNLAGYDGNSDNYVTTEGKAYLSLHN